MDSAEASRVELNDTAAARRRIPRVVVVDQQFDAYSELATSARLGRLEVHFRSSGAAAIKMATRRPADIWLVAGELDDMSGADFIELLRERLGEPTVAGVNHSAGRQEGSRKPAPTCRSVHRSVLQTSKRCSECLRRSARRSFPVSPRGSLRHCPSGWEPRLWRSPC